MLFRSAYKFADSVAHSIGLGDADDGFAYIEMLHEETGVRIPSALKDLDKKEILHRGILDIDQMKDAVYECLKLHN